MSKLHELLAVDSKVKSQAATIIGETHQEFSNRPNHFTEQQVVFKPNEEGAEDIPEGGHSMASTVRKRLEYTFRHICKMMDVDFNIESSNQMAKADVVIGGTKIVEDAPATWLLHCEKRLSEVINLLKKAPSLDVSKRWEKVTNEFGDIHRVVDDDIRIRTKKVTKSITMAEATEHHPAQCQLVSEDIPIGKVVTKFSSGQLSSAEKADIIDRAERLLRAVKKARSKANNTDATNRKVSKTFFDFILDGENDNQDDD